MSKLLFGLLLSVSIGSAYAAEKPEVVCNTFNSTKSATSAINDGVDKTKGNLSAQRSLEEFMKCPGSEAEASAAIEAAVAKDPKNAAAIVQFAIGKGVPPAAAAQAASAAAPTQTGNIYAAANLPAPTSGNQGGLMSATSGVPSGVVIISGNTGGSTGGGGGGSGCTGASKC